MDEIAPRLAPGMHNVSNDVHHADPAIGSSGLKEILRSPAHYHAKYLDPNRAPEKRTPAKALGTAWHVAVFEGVAEFDRRYIGMPEGLDRRTKEGKDLYAEIVASGREPLPAAECATIAAMSAAARRHPVGRILFAADNAITERSIVFPLDALRGKIRPDYMVPPCDGFPAGLLIDGKSAEDARAEAFGRAAWNYGYLLQAAWYVTGFQRHFRTSKPPTFIWLVQEKEAPFATQFYRAAPGLLAFGRGQYERAFGVYADCLRRDDWPAYGGNIVDLAMPAWAAKEIEGASS